MNCNFPSLYSHIFSAPSLSPGDLLCRIRSFWLARRLYGIKHLIERRPNDAPENEQNPLTESTWTSRYVPHWAQSLRLETITTQIFYRNLLSPIIRFYDGRLPTLIDLLALRLYITCFCPLQPHTAIGFAVLLSAHCDHCWVRLCTNICEVVYFRQVVSL